MYKKIPIFQEHIYIYIYLWNDFFLKITDFSLGLLEGALLFKHAIDQLSTLNCGSRCLVVK